MHILVEINDITADDKATALPPLFVASMYETLPNHTRRHLLSFPAENTEAASMQSAHTKVMEILNKDPNASVSFSLPSDRKAAA